MLSHVSVEMLNVERIRLKGWRRTKNGEKAEGKVVVVEEVCSNNERQVDSNSAMEKDIQNQLEKRRCCNNNVVMLTEPEERRVVVII